MPLTKDSKLPPTAATMPPGVIPYDYPESLLDSVELDPDGHRIRAYVRVRPENCQGVTFGQPIFPGSRLGDCLYLAFSILIRQSARVADRVRDGRLGVRALDRNFRYRRPIRPGERVVLEVELVRQRGSTLIARARAEVDGELAFEGDELWITLVPPAHRNCENGSHAP